MQLPEREPTLDALGGWFAEARAGRGRLVLVGGEAGSARPRWSTSSRRGSNTPAGSSGAPVTR